MVKKLFKKKDKPKKEEMLDVKDKFDGPSKKGDKIPEPPKPPEEDEEEETQPARITDGEILETVFLDVRTMMPYIGDLAKENKMILAELENVKTDLRALKEMIEKELS